ncbi:MAG TPA: hypothetical protein VLW50_07625 [Streptosporangiaceae bacterium]|nr:hypothetical protein [Streptosporangiaceae bacterium]
MSVVASFALPYRARILAAPLCVVPGWHVSARRDLVSAGRACVSADRFGVSAGRRTSSGRRRGVSTPR